MIMQPRSDDGRRFFERTFLAMGMSMLAIPLGMDCQGTMPGTTPPANTGGPVIPDSDHVMGDANAAVTVVEYSDIQ